MIRELPANIKFPTRISYKTNTVIDFTYYVLETYNLSPYIFFNWCSILKKKLYAALSKILWIIILTLIDLLIMQI